MPLKLPELDDRQWTDLVEEGRSLIPGYARAWTNYNPADPGVTLVELFAFLAENLIYRIDQVTDANTIAFLRLINGPGWKPGPNLLADQRTTLENLWFTRRAVTPSDFEELTLHVNQTIPHAEPRIARVKAIPNRNLESGKPGAQTDSAPGHVSVIVLPTRDRVPPPALLKRVHDALEPARLLTTVIHVLPPRFVTFGLRLAIGIRRGAGAESIRGNVLRALASLFDPLAGGADCKGWPFGRSVYLSDIYQVAASAAGVVSVSRVFDRETNRHLSELILPSGERKRIVRNEAHDTEAIELRPDELPLLEIREEDLVIVEEGARI